MLRKQMSGIKLDSVRKSLFAYVNVSANTSKRQTRAGLQRLKVQ